jgi:hypothetical protein
MKALAESKKWFLGLTRSAASRGAAWSADMARPVAGGLGRGGTPAGPEELVELVLDPREPLVGLGDGLLQGVEPAGDLFPEYPPHVQGGADRREKRHPSPLGHFGWDFVLPDVEPADARGVGPCFVLRGLRTGMAAYTVPFFNPNAV